MLALNVRSFDKILKKCFVRSFVRLFQKKIFVRSFVRLRSTVERTNDKNIFFKSCRRAEQVFVRVRRPRLLIILHSQHFLSRKCHLYKNILRKNRAQTFDRHCIIRCAPEWVFMFGCSASSGIWLWLLACQRIETNWQNFSHLKCISASGDWLFP